MCRVRSNTAALCFALILTWSRTGVFADDGSPPSIAVKVDSGSPGKFLYHDRLLGPADFATALNADLKRVTEAENTKPEKVVLRIEVDASLPFAAIREIQEISRAVGLRRCRLVHVAGGKPQVPGGFDMPLYFEIGEQPEAGEPGGPTIRSGGRRLVGRRQIKLAANPDGTIAGMEIDGKQLVGRSGYSALKEFIARCAAEAGGRPIPIVLQVPNNVQASEYGLALCVCLYGGDPQSAEVNPIHQVYFAPTSARR